MAEPTPPFVSVAIVLVLSASAALWFRLARRWRQGHAVLPYLARRPVPWGVLDLLVVIMLLSLLEALSIQASGVNLQAGLDALSVDQQARLITLNGLLRLVTIAGAVALLVYRWRATPSDLGLPTTRSQALDDLRLGSLGTLLALLPVFLLNWVLTQVTAYEHAILDVFDNTESWWHLLAMTVVAGIVAPVFEEFAFRLLLQGWLEKLEFEFARTSLIARFQQEQPLEDGSQALAQAEQALNAHPPSGAMPILVSSTLFALMHVGQGAAPAPLFLFALVLGLLYHRTHRVTPCILAHMLFNGFSLVIIWASLLSKTGIE